jgi:DNA-binding PadR family transcriptional regulator
MYELLVLALLMRWPLHAYLIADIANNILGPWEKISRGSLSALLMRLEQAGFITLADPAQVPFPTDRPSRVFAITPAGRERFSHLMRDTTSNPGTYQRLFRIKALHLEFVSPEDQLYLVDHYLMYCQTGFRYQQTEAQEFASNRMKQEHASDFFCTVALDMMGVMAQGWQLEIAWARRLRERIVTAIQLDNHDMQRKTEEIDG